MEASWFLTLLDSKKHESANTHTILQLRQNVQQVPGAKVAILQVRALAKIRPF